VDVTRDELVARLGEPGLNLLDVRTPEEYRGEAGYPSDPRQGHIPGARNVDVAELLGLGPDEVRKLIGLPEGAEVVTYCHSGARSATAAWILVAAGYDARNYVGSWQEWSRDPDLPSE
jgi:thiosulfate/3-mercaptopyruvate sulfurtransferase